MWLHKAAPVDSVALASFSSMYPNFNPNARQIRPSDASGMVPWPCALYRERADLYTRENDVANVTEDPSRA
jgi:hypothetical protein